MPDRQVEKKVCLLAHSPEFLLLREMLALQQEAGQAGRVKLPYVVIVNCHVGDLSSTILMMVIFVGMEKIAEGLHFSPLHVLEELSHPCRLLQDLLVKHQEPPHPTETSGIIACSFRLLTQMKPKRDSNFCSSINKIKST